MTGRLDAHQTAPGTFLAVRVKTFTISKNEHINCALKTKVDGAWKTVALQGRQFQCIKRPDAAGPNTVTTPVHPTHSEPVRIPPVVVIPEPPRTIVDCAPGFTKVGRRCVRVACQKGEKLVRNRCIPRIVECLRGFKKVGQSCIRITCQRSEILVNGHCKVITVSCPDGYTKLRGKCIKPATRPVQCTNGRLVRGRCVNARPSIEKRGNPRAAIIGRSRKAARRN